MKAQLFSRERILYIDRNGYLSYRKGTIYYCNFNTTNRCKIDGKKNYLCLLDRLTRKEPRCAAKVDNNHIVFSFGGKIYNYCISDNSLDVEHVFSKGMNNPLEFLTISSVDGDENTIFYGEYIRNEEKGPVSIYKRKNEKWECVYSFPTNTIKHIHNLVYDKYRKCFLILTGDEDSESGIWYADYRFENVYPLLLGKQQYRACVAFPDEKGIFFATDTPLEKNYIYYVQIDERLQVEEVKEVFEMPGPCIYGCQHNGKMYFSTSVEPDSTLSKWHYYFTYKLGKGVFNWYSHLIVGYAGGRFEEVCKFKKDILPMGLFQFGNILFPNNSYEELLIVLQATTKGHDVTYKLEK